MMIAAAPVLNGTGTGKPMGTGDSRRGRHAGEVRMLGARAQAALSMVGHGSAASGGQIVETGDVTRVDRSFQEIYTADR